MLIPIKTNAPLRRIPRVNHAIIAINVVVYLFTNVLSAISRSELGNWLAAQFALMLPNWEWQQFIGYQFLHDDVWHLFGNMIFLWVFGNSVNAKMGHIPYLLFYLAAGVFAAIGFAATNPGHAMLIGASGAIAGVTTAYLVLYPRTEITVFYWLFILIGTIRIKALLLIGLKIILWDNILAPNIGGGGATVVAYSAHITGYLFGIVICSLLLILRILPRDHFDIVALARQYYRRQRFKATLTDANAEARATYGRVARPVSTATGRPVEVPLAVPVDEITLLRGEISELVSKNDYTTAAQRYEALVTKDPNQCLPRANMLLIANQLMSLNHYPQAAAAYEKFLKAYPTDADALQIKLVLGILFAKYLQQHKAAQPYLQECAVKLTDSDQVRQANHWLDQAKELHRNDVNG